MIEVYLKNGNISTYPSSRYYLIDRGYYFALYSSDLRYGYIGQYYYDELEQIIVNDEIIFDN